MVRGLAKVSTVPVALHLDHCKDVRFVKQCIDAGWSSVMVDGSSESFENNVAMTKEVVEYAHTRNVTVEGELGAIVGVEDDIFVKEGEAHLANPEQAIVFVQRTGVDVFAPAIGTAHGIYKGEPKIAFDRLERISEDCQIPIAIHGGTGLSDEVFARCITLGGVKINVSTQIKHTFRDSLEGYFRDHPGDYEPVKPVGHMMAKIQAVIEQFIEVFGSAGKVGE
jgi:ketose-bisphosphate aldolase